MWIHLSDELRRDVRVSITVDTRPLRRAVERVLDLAVYGWVPPIVDPNPMPRFRLWRIRRPSRG